MRRTALATMVGRSREGGWKASLKRSRSGVPSTSAPVLALTPPLVRGCRVEDAWQGLAL